jgi:hypothetical protein
LVGTAVAASSLVATGGLALAAGKPGTPKVKPVVLRCTFSLSTTPPAGQANVDQPPAQGNQYGPVHCPRKGFGGGIEADTFTVPDTGDTVGTYWDYLKNGSVTGKFDLTPNEGAPLTGDNFTAQTWTGTVTLTGGTGIYKGIKGKKGTGVITCTSPDSVHLSCHSKVKVFLPATV